MAAPRTRVARHGAGHLAAAGDRAGLLGWNIQHGDKLFTIVQTNIRNKRACTAKERLVVEDVLGKKPRQAAAERDNAVRPQCAGVTAENLLGGETSPAGVGRVLRTVEIPEAGNCAHDWGDLFGSSAIRSGQRRVKTGGTAQELPLSLTSTNPSARNSSRRSTVCRSQTAGSTSNSVDSCAQRSVIRTGWPINSQIREPMRLSP